MVLPSLKTPKAKQKAPERKRKPLDHISLSFSLCDARMITRHNKGE
jgi:hypothetical protein